MPAAARNTGIPAVIIRSHQIRTSHPTPGTAAIILVVRSGGFRNGLISPVHVHSSGTDKITLEETGLYGFDANVIMTARRMDKLAVAKVNACMIAAIAAAERHDITRPHFGNITNFVADSRLLGSSTRNSNAGSAVGPLHQPRAVEPARIFSAEDIGSAQGSPCPAHHILRGAWIPQPGSIYRIPVHVIAVGVSTCCCLIRVTKAFILGDAVIRFMLVRTAKAQHTNQAKNKQSI